MKRAFTLVELIVVIVIIGILGSIAIPAYLKIKERSYSAEAWVNVGALFKGEKAYYLDHESWQFDISQLPVDNPNDNASRRFNYTCGNAVYLYFRGTGIAARGTGWQYEIRCVSCGSSSESIQRWELPPGGSWQQVD